MPLWKAGGARTYIWKFVEVVSAVKELKLEKSPGIDGTYSKHYKYADGSVCMIIKNIKAIAYIGN